MPHPPLRISRGASTRQVFSLINNQQALKQTHSFYFYFRLIFSLHSLTQHTLFHIQLQQTIHFKTLTAGVLAAGSLNAVLAAPMGRVHNTPCASSTGAVDAVVSKLPLMTESQQAVETPTHTPCTTISTHTPCSSSTTVASDALNVPRQAVETAWLAPSAPLASPPQQATPALNTPALAPSAPAATPSPPQATPTYTYEETHRPAPDNFGTIATIITLSVLGGVVLLVALWALWSWRRGGKPFACFGSCCGRTGGARKPRVLDEESIALAGAGHHYGRRPVSAEVEMVASQQWPGRGGEGEHEHVPAPVIVEMEPPRCPEEMVYQARGQTGRPVLKWARGF